jgi:hypothetical protein
MVRGKQGKAVVVVLLLVIGLALAFVVKGALPKRYPQPKVDWICEACGYAFVAPVQAKPMVCPKCKGEVVQTHYYYDTVNNEMFEAYRTKPNPGVAPSEEMGMPEEMTLYKVPGGKWTTTYPEKITSPKGVSDWSKLEYCSPTSERRKK